MDLVPRIQEGSRHADRMARLDAFLAALSHVSARIGITSDPRQVIESIRAELRGMGLDCAVMLSEPGEDALTVHDAWHEPDVLTPAHELPALGINRHRIPADQEPFRQVLQAQRTVFVPDALELATKLFSDVPEKTAEHADQLVGVAPNVRMACLPLVIAEQTVGALAIWGPDLLETDIPALSVFAGYMATSIENARNTDRLQAVMDSQGRGIGGFHDITERVELQQTLQEEHGKLERRAEERPSDLLESDRRLEREVSERQRVESMLRQQTDEFTVVNTLNRLIGASLSPDRVVEATLEGIGNCVAPDLTMLYLLEGDDLILQGVRATIPELEHFGPGVHRIGRCLCGLAAAEKRPFYSRDIRTDPLCTLAECKEAGLRSLAALPLLSGDQVLGVLGVASVRERDYGQQSTFWEALSSEVAIGVQNARLHRQLQDHAAELERQIVERARTENHLQERNRELALLSRSIQALNSALATERVLASIMEQVRRLLGVTACSVWLLDAESGELVCQQAIGQASDKVIGWRLPLGEGIVGWSVQAGEILNVPDTRVDERHFKGIDRQTGVELRSVLTVPLRVKGKVTGALQVMDGATSRFGPTDVTLVELLALSAANALENARIHEALQVSQQELERRNQDLLVLNSLATTIGQSLSLEQVLSQSLDKVLELTRTDAAWAGLFGPEADSLSMAVNRGLSEETASDLEAAGLHWPENKKRIRSGEPIVMTAALRESGLGFRSSDGRRPAAFVSVPIRARENVIGVLGGLFYQTSEIDAQDVQLLVAIGHQLGVAIENVHLLEEASEIEVLRDLDRMRSELIATASHELRTPLGLIRIFATALLMDEVTFDSETHHQFLVGIADESEKLESILDNLLDLSRMESGRLLLDRRPVDLRGLARDAVTGMSPGLAGRQVVDLGDEPLSAEVDPARIEQVLRNLLSNAIKYSPEGGTITVRGCQAGDRILISVIDQGIGIPLEEQSRIFERFYRVDNDVTRRTRGAGLGLSICKWIVEAHNGSIWVQSEPGSGSEFRIVLPAIG